MRIRGSCLFERGLNRGFTVFILNFQASPRMLPSSRPRTCTFLTRLIGGDNQTLYRPITSPYTSRILKPFIRRDYESRPLKLKLLQDIVSHYHRYSLILLPGGLFISGAFEGGGFIESGDSLNLPIRGLYCIDSP